MTAGSGLVLDYSSAIAIVLPSLLLLLGGATLSSSLVFLRWHHAPAASTRTSAGTILHPSTRPPAPPLVPAAPRGATTPLVALLPAPSAVPPRPFGWGEVFATVSSPGYQLWHEWQPAGSDSIGTEVIGPVPETYFAPVAEGRFDPFPEKAPDWVIEESAPAATMALGGPDGAGGSGVAGIPNGLTCGVEFEALTAVPPHLRTVGPGPAKLLPLLIAEPRTPAALAAKTCASCTSMIGDPRWRACPGCHLPVCADCILDALLAYGTGFCVECASERSLVVN